MPTPISALALAALSSFEVQGPSTCPRPEQVSAYLAAVPSDGAHRVELASSSAAVRVRLLDRRGALVGERELARNSSCKELAEAAAVLISAWMIEMPALELPPLEPETTIAVAPLADAPPAPLPVSRTPPRLELTPFTPAVIHTAPESNQRGGDHEMSVGFSAGVGPRFTLSNGLVASYLYWPLAGLAVEGALNLQLHTALTLKTLEANSKFLEGAPLSDLHAPLWDVSVGAVASIARGPVRLAGVWSGPSIELYGVLGVGVGEVSRPDLGGSSPEAIFDFGAGFRTYLFREAIALELELRDLFFYDPLSTGVTHNVQLQGGLRLAMDASAWEARVLDDRARSRGGRFSITPAGGASLLDGFSSTGVLSLAVAYDVFDFIGVETIGAYLSGGPNAITRELLEVGRTRAEPAKLTELRWAVVFGLRVNLLRGRFTSLGLPFGGDLTLYVAGGGGFGRTRAVCIPGSTLDPNLYGLDALCPSSVTDGPFAINAFSHAPSRATGLGHVGGGITLDLIDWLGLTLELRDFIFRSAFEIPSSGSFSDVLRHVFVAQGGVTLLLL